MSFEAERAVIETWFDTGWRSGPFSNVPVVYDNTPILELPQKEFVYHRIISGEGRQMEIVGEGTPFSRYVGLVQVDILVPPNTGSAKARRMADAISSIYRRKQIGNQQSGLISFQVPSVLNFGQINEKFRLAVTCRFLRNIRQ